MRQTCKLKQGYILLLVIGLIGVLFTLGLAVVQFMASQRHLLRKTEETALARESSRAGVNLGLARLRRDPQWRAGFKDTATVPGAVADLRVEAPGGPLHLICQGRVNSTVATYEAVVYPEEVLLDNDFSRDANDWRQPGSLPIVLLGYYALRLGLPGEAVAGQTDWTDYEATFEVLLPQVTDVGFLVRASNLGAYVVDYSFLRGDLRLSKESSHGTQVLNQQSRRDLVLPHTFTIKVEGGDLSVSLDGHPALTFQDSDPLPQGQIGIRPLLGSLTLVDRVHVRSILKVVAQWPH